MSNLFLELPRAVFQKSYTFSDEPTVEALNAIADELIQDFLGVVKGAVIIFTPSAHEPQQRGCVTDIVSHTQSYFRFGNPKDKLNQDIIYMPSFSSVTFKTTSYDDGNRVWAINNFGSSDRRCLTKAIGGLAVRFEDKTIENLFRGCYEILEELASQLIRTEQKKRDDAAELAKIKDKETRRQKHIEAQLVEFEQTAEEIQNSTKSAADDFYEALGWLAKHIGTVSAKIPDYLENLFIKTFGTQTSCYVVDSSKRTINGNSMQWTFGFKAALRKVNSIPEVLTQYLSSNGKAITNTAFIWDLIDNYGFQFGTKQNLDSIIAAVPVIYRDSFNEGLNT